MRNRVVSEMIRSRCTLMKLSGTRTRPLPDSLPSFVMAFSISDGSCTSAVMGRTFNFVADSMNGREKKLAVSWHGIRIVHDGNAGELRHHLFQHLEIFPCDTRVQDREAGDVAARSRHARDKPATNRIGHGDEHDRNGPRGLHQRVGDRGALAENAVWLELYQLFRQRLHARGVAFGIAVLDAKVLAEGPALRFETFFERLDASLGLRIVCEAHQHPDDAHANSLLRFRRDRLVGPGAAEKSYEFASSNFNCHPPPRPYEMDSPFARGWKHIISIVIGSRLPKIIQRF